LKSIIAFTSTRRHGNARTRSGLNRILRARHLPTSIATGKQVHGTHVRVIPKLNRGKEYPATDGFLTREKGQPLGIFTADCTPIFLSAPSQGVVGLLHAGWRGVRAGILKKAFDVMRRRWGCKPRDVRVWLGPCIGPCCFEVRWDVARYFPTARQVQGDRWIVDLAKDVQRQARRLGLNMRGGIPGCTRHQTRYHSFRRNSTEERQISVIMRT
jgi:polyphenol oxidase